MSNFCQLQTDGNNIAWLHLNQEGSSANVLSESALESIDHCLIAAAQSHPRALVLISDKAAGFIAGADVKSFALVQERHQAEQLIRRAQQIFGRLEAFSFPTIALIRGHCLGGGLELALACRYRVVSDEPQTKLGFPEVRLGIFPGFGGTVRSVEKLGHLKALEMMLSGRSLSGRSAKAVGLADLCVPARQFGNAVAKLVSDAPQPVRPSWLKRLPGNPILRPLVAWALARQVAKQANPAHYPAPHRLIAHWQHNAGNVRSMYESEARMVPELILGDSAQNLIRVFLLQDRLKSLAGKDQGEFQHVHVVGGGIMGGDIAAWCALKGMRVTLQDRAPQYLGRAVQRASELFRKELKDPYLLQSAQDRLIPDHQGYGVSQADVVIEAIFEDAAAKQSLFHDLEPRLKPDAILASNTSSIPLQTLAEQLARPERLVGLHFFNPVAKMPLVEVVSHAGTDPGMAARALAFAKKIGKLPLPVTSTPGFLVNRVLMPYLLEAVRLFEEGTPPEQIDRAATSFGMPMGPIELADTVGLDICLSVAQKMSALLKREVPTSLQERVDAGNLGRKSGQGYYSWKNGRTQKAAVKIDRNQSEALAERILLPMINECVACLREKVVADADLVDAGVIFGTGFAPFRGGPMRHAATVGTAELQQRLSELEKTLGENFHPDAGWATL